jgi:uncharacterized protein
VKALAMLLALSVILLAGCAEEESPEPQGGEPPATQQAAPPEGAYGEDVPTSELPVLRIDAADGPIEVPVEVAATDAERQRGLMGRPELEEKRGMLFVFEEERPLSFWMKNTLIPLSIAYIDSEGRIVDLQDMEPGDPEASDAELPRYPSAEPARYALEVNRGFFEERGVEVGDEVDLPL